MASMSVLATEYLHCKVVADDDPTGDVVQWAFLDRGTQWPNETTTWVDGGWKPGSTAQDAVARVLVGPENGGHPLTVGQYRVWLRITDNPEVPVKLAGYLTMS